jgi:hypothetical protein
VEPCARPRSSDGPPVHRPDRRPGLGPYIAAEVVGWVAGHVERDFELWTEDELELMLPHVLDAWRRRDDSLAELWDLDLPGLIPIGDHGQRPSA